SQRLRYIGRLAVESNTVLRPLHRWTIDLAGYFDFASRFAGAKRSHFVVNDSSVQSGFYAHIDFGPCFSGDYVAAGSAANQSHVCAHAALDVGKRSNLFNLVRQFVNSARSLARVYAGMGRLSSNFDFVNTDSLA